MENIRSGCMISWWGIARAYKVIKGFDSFNIGGRILRLPFVRDGKRRVDDISITTFNVLWQVFQKDMGM